MNETTKAIYSEVLDQFVAARKRLANATVDYDRERHAARTALYALKESGTRKMTEEQIRSESVVQCRAVYEEYTNALAECEIARERLEYVKTIANN